MGTIYESAGEALERPGQGGGDHITVQDDKLVSQSQKRLGKVISGLLAVVILGAVGSGLWDLALSPFLRWFVSVFVDAVSSVYTSYIDSLHGRIGAGFADYISLLPFVVWMTAFVLFPWAALLYAFRGLRQITAEITSLMKKANGETDEKQVTPEGLLQRVVKLRKKLLIIAIPCCLVISLLYMSTFIEGIYTYKAGRYAQRSIEMLAPCVSNQMVLELRAEFRSVDSAQKFYDLDERLRGIAEEHGVVLPDVWIIR